MAIIGHITPIVLVREMVSGDTCVLVRGDMMLIVLAQLYRLIMGDLRGMLDSGLSL